MNHATLLRLREKLLPLPVSDASDPELAERIGFALMDSGYQRIPALDLDAPENAGNPLRMELHILTREENTLWDHVASNPAVDDNVFFPLHAALRALCKAVDQAGFSETSIPLYAAMKASACAIGLYLMSVLPALPLLTYCRERDRALEQLFHKESELNFKQRGDGSEQAQDGEQ